MIKSYEIISVTKNVSANVTKTISLTVASIVSINCDYKNAIYKVTLLLFIIVIICIHYVKYRSKQKILQPRQYKNGE